MEEYPFSDKDDGYLLCVGRISMEKGFHHAIEVAQYLDMPYFNEYIAPRLSDEIRWIGEVDETERNKLYSRARCLLHPITFREPFGLTLIEAMACGASVVAFGLGSIPEVVEHGKTGFVVNNVEDMIDAVLELDTINRADCRAHVLKEFNAKKMADGYEEIYCRVTEIPSTRIVE